jgi:hypothetical protein
MARGVSPGDVHDTRQRPVDRRVILLGASNVALSFRRITGLVRAGFPGSIDVFAAHGHGRSYGRKAWIPGRALPGITECGLWRALADAPSPRFGTQFLVTDVGNDLIYGADADDLLGWVTTCVERVAVLARDDPGPLEVVLTGLPIARMHALVEWHYRAIIGLLFPTCEVPFETLKRNATLVDEGLVDLAERSRAVRIAPPIEWYGLDPIHVMRSYRLAAWRRVLSGWPSIDLGPELGPQPAFSPLWWLHQRPAERWFLGRHQVCRQPIVDRGDFRLFVY